MIQLQLLPKEMMADQHPEVTTTQAVVAEAQHKKVNLQVPLLVVQEEMEQQLQYQDLQQHTLEAEAEADMPAAILQQEELEAADLTAAQHRMQLERQIQAAELHQEQVDQVS
jgi:hypothetical protein